LSEAHRTPQKMRCSASHLTLSPVNLIPGPSNSNKRVQKETRAHFKRGLGLGYADRKTPLVPSIWDNLIDQKPERERKEGRREPFTRSNNLGKPLRASQSHSNTRRAPSPPSSPLSEPDRKDLKDKGEPLDRHSQPPPTRGQFLLRLHDC